MNDIEKNYGLKKDGTPKNKPGRKKKEEVRLNTRFAEKSTISGIAPRKRGRPPKNKSVNLEQSSSSETTAPETIIASSTETIINNEPVVVPSTIDCPVFKYGDKVESIPEVKNQHTQGVVEKYDDESKYVFVNWKNDVKYWSHAKTLRIRK